jgi:hypothetical protein
MSPRGQVHGHRPAHAGADKDVWTAGVESPQAGPGDDLVTVSLDVLGLFIEGAGLAVVVEDEVGPSPGLILGAPL